MISWHFRIYTLLNLAEKSHKLISDHTGILSTPTFISFLKEKHTSANIIDSIPEILSITGREANLLIITSLIELPTFITNKYEHRHFTLANIPLNGQLTPLLNSLPTSNLIQLLDYCYSTDPHIVLTENNLSDLLWKSVDFAGMKEIGKLKDHITDLLSKEPNYISVLQSGSLFGELIYLSYKYKYDGFSDFIPAIDNYSEHFVTSGKVKNAFFASVPANPVTIDRILHNIASEKQDKIALICFDCMGWSEWSLLKEYFADLNFQFQESELFALLPTVTSISRSAIFQGNTDIYNIKSPGKEFEDKTFTEFFSAKDTKCFMDKELITDETLLGYNCISILFTFFDDLCHSAQIPDIKLGKELYFDSIWSYLKKINLKQILLTILQNGFSIYICSDHGSIVATGNGVRIEKYLIDKFAKRACIIPANSSELTDLKKVPIPFVSDKIMILPEGREMFTTKGKLEINHGGVTVEEMVVPYIKIVNYG